MRIVACNKSLTPAIAPVVGRHECRLNGLLGGSLLSVKALPQFQQ